MHRINFHEEVPACRRMPQRLFLLHRERLVGWSPRAHRPSSSGQEKQIKGIEAAFKNEGVRERPHCHLVLFRQLAGKVAAVLLHGSLENVRGAKLLWDG